MKRKLDKKDYNVVQGAERHHENMSPLWIVLETHPPTSALLTLLPKPSKSFPEGGEEGAFVSGSWSETQYPASFSLLPSLSLLVFFFFFRKDSHLAWGST